MKLTQLIGDDGDHILLGSQLLGFVRREHCREPVQSELVVDQDGRGRDTGSGRRLDVLALQVAPVLP